MSTWHLHITGQVQGVGFRPFVYALAGKMGLKGEVNNGLDGVHVIFNATNTQAQSFANSIAVQAPSLAVITSCKLLETPSRTFNNFSIVASEEEGEASLLISPDFGLCADCDRELHEPNNRRHAYPFITCTNCGPRYGILRSLPYDREHTTMDVFKMCHSCKTEYEDPSNRRYYSQTNSCPECSITLSLFDQTGKLISSDPQNIQTAVNKAWQSGQIVAIKGTGGYLLTCDTINAAAIRRLRQKKVRPEKPLALMYGKTAQLSLWNPSLAALELLESPAAPIVLIPVSPDFPNLDLIAPGLSSVGMMRAHNPLFQWLLDGFDRPIVATSGNVSGTPIVFKDVEAIEQLSPLADLILGNNRDISIPQDDSLIRLSPLREKQILLRRSRGYAPTFIQSELQTKSGHILATGAMLKSTFSLQSGDRFYISQYLGNLDSFDTQNHYRFTLEYLRNLLRENPELVLCDAHPDYPSTRIGEALGQQLNVPLLPVGHHLAHFAAVLGENQLLHSKSPVLGVIWDGTGLGSDGQLWGGEFFSYHHYQFERRGHFSYFPVIAGDKMAREPRLSALALCHRLPQVLKVLKEKFTEAEWRIYHGIIEKAPRLQSSSAGRIFDAVASILGICDIQSWEGAAATQLENLAISWIQKEGLNDLPTYPLCLTPEGQLNCDSLFAQIVEDSINQVPPAKIAARFHHTLAHAIRNFARQGGMKKVAFSGGVFQNGLLTDLINLHMEGEFELYFHQQLSPNDENISFGQIIYHHIQEYQKSFKHPKSQEYVFSNTR